MNTGSLREELDRIRHELELSHRRLGEAAEGLAALRETLGDRPVGTGADAARGVSSGVVSNVPESALRSAAATADARETVRLRASDVARVLEQHPPRSEQAARAPGAPGEPEPIPSEGARRSTGERPAARTLPGAGPDVFDSGRIPRPRRDTIPGPGQDGKETARVPRPSAEAAEARGREDERPTAEYTRPQRETLTYFFGVDGPAPDEETELGPVGGARVPDKDIPDPQ